MTETQLKAALNAELDNGHGDRDYQWFRSYPKNVDWCAELKGEPLQDILDRTVRDYGDTTCTYFMGATMSYKQIGALVDKTAKGLQAMGVKKGTRVGLLLPNVPYFPILYYGALKAGAIVVNFNPLYTVEELAHQVKDSGTTIMATLDLALLFPKVEAMLSSGALERAIICPFPKILPSIKGTLFKLLKGKELAKIDASAQRGKITPFYQLTANDGRYKPVPVDPDNDIAVLQYTGGTTGTPKGAMLTHSNLSINVKQADLWEVNSEKGKERIMAVLPFFHVFAMTTIMNRGVAIAGQMILVPRFDLEMVIKLIRATKPTIMPGVPTLFNAIRNYPKLNKDDLKSLRSGISGGAPLPVELKRNFEKEAGVILVEGYGLSETSPIATANPFDGPVKEGSIGLPMPGTVISLRSLDDPSQEVPLGERGEICIAGPQVMKGYWNKPEETKAAFVGEFFRSGDVAMMDEDGFIYIVDRIKDLILCSGYNVYPRRIEEAIYQHPAVEEVTVIGIPDEYRGEAPKAFIKLRVGQSVTEAEMFKFLEPKLSKIEMPCEIEFRDALPKTMVGKLSKKELRAEAKAS
jgi:long-chain acyl-CoA synthetase